MNTIDYFGQLINYLRNLEKYWIKDIYNGLFQIET